MAGVSVWLSNAQRKLWTACSPLQLFDFSSLLLSHSPWIPEPPVEPSPIAGNHRGNREPQVSCCYDNRIVIKRPAQETQH